MAPSVTSDPSSSGLPGAPDVRQMSADPYVGLALKAASALAFHPTEYAKTLIQLGHEPMPMTHTKTLMGRPALALPSVFR